MSDNGDEGFEEITDEEKLHIAQHYLLSSPPGQFNEVLSDVRKIVSSGVLSDSVAAGIARVANLKACRIVSTANGQKAIIAPAAEIDTTNYINPVTQTTFSVDHLTLSTNPSEGTVPSSNSDMEELRSALQAKLSDYAKSAYHPTEQRSAGVFLSSDGNALTVVIAGEKTNLKNFWSGRWGSTWQVQNISATSCSISGELKIHVHYFEDGNLQMQSSKTYAPVTISFSSPADFSQAIQQHIQKEENNFQSGLEDMYSNMNTETIRSMRRVMPITKTKMEWNVNAVRMVRQVRK